AFLVFSPDEQVGGIVFSTQDPTLRGIRYECVNGPHLDWDHPQLCPRQLATFAMAVSKLSGSFQSLSIRPRWEQRHTANRLRILPISPFNQTHAATLIVALQKSKEA